MRCGIFSFIQAEELEAAYDDTSSEDSEDAEEPPDHFLELVVATKENTKNVGWMITDDDDVIKQEDEIR